MLAHPQQGRREVALDIKQANRLLRITTPLGPDVLVLRHLSVTEAVESPFIIAAEVISARDDLQPKDLIGKTITCTVQVEDAPARHFSGMVRAFARTGSQERSLTGYWLEAVPLLWNLSRTSDCRIFQDMSASDILKKIFGEGGVEPNRFGGLPGTPRPYCVQFNETDLDFTHRLLDEVGGSYFFQHAEGSHTLVITGSNADFPLLQGEPLVVRTEADRPDAISRWQPQGSLPPGKRATLDFDGIKPSKLLTANAATMLPYPSPSSWEMFRWPGGQGARPDIDPAKLGMEQEEAQADLVNAASRNPALHAGARVKVKPDLAGGPETWLITAVRHEAVDETHLGQDGTAEYANTITLTPADRVWRNPHPRPRPQMPAVQSAIVTGPAGEEIHTDEYGRVKVHFHWDRAGRKDETSTCWVRVAQPFAGAWGGSWFLPRIGDEVLIAFLDGDPDRPVVIGSVYNSDGKPPFPLPGNKTQSGIRTRSSKGGGQDNANILRMDDKKGSEEVYFQAEKDHNLLVKNDRTDVVRHDRTTTIHNADTLTVKKADRTVTLEQGNLSTTVKMGNETREISQGNRETAIKMGNETLKIDMGNRTTELGMGNDELTLKMGNLTIKCALGAITLEAMQSITLKVGQSEVKVDQMGVSVKGMMLKSEGQMMTEVKGLMTKIDGSAMLQATGGIIMIG